MEKEQLVLDKIIQTVAEEYQVSAKAIIGKARIRDVSEARQICAYILREQKYKRCDIAQQLNRKPKTIYYELQQARILLSADKSVKKHYESIKKELELWTQY